MKDEEFGDFDAAVVRRESLIRRACKIMGWEYHTSPVWTGLRKIALCEAVPISLDKLEEILNRLERTNGPMPEKPMIETTGIWLRSSGHKLQVLVEVGGTWRVAIEEMFHPPEDAISHIAEPLGIKTW